MERERLYWTDQRGFPLEEELEPLFAEALLRGYRPYRDLIDGRVSTAAFGVEGGQREAFFILRGLGRRFSGLLWEVLPNEGERCVRLAPLFGLSETSCIVVSGTAAVRSVCFSWIEHGDVNKLVRVARFYNRLRMDVLTPLESDEATL